ncbi:hypothetical protein BG011_001530 [Mortierella polycephala]|uniref:Uncharacterized protein n=1 Tax=Mortierella polycephala TaxID=41804 RepID=A0A9P6Q572_9FUNG|nr:hypothetical protein BG011_001530 [Mortierella polycephala]
MDPKEPQQLNNKSRESQGQSPSQDQSPSRKGKEPVSNAGTQQGTGSESGSGWIDSLTSSARNIATALDPRQPDLIRQHHSFGTSGSGVGSSTKASTSSATRSFQHASNALETIENNQASSNQGITSGPSIQSTGFRGPATSQGGTGASADTGAMDWDNFLSSSESTVLDDQPYKPPTMESFGFSSMTTPSESSSSHMHHQDPVSQLPGLSQQAHQDLLSQSVNLTPDNHADFLEYLKSTAHQPSSPFALPNHPQYYQQQQQQQQQGQWHSPSNASRFSNDIQHQQRLDGSDVLAFLESTSYSDYVDELESAGIEKHQQERREFVYSEDTLGPVGVNTQSLFSTLQLIQHLPSERQDIVQYLLQQGTYTDDIYSRPFGHDTMREEAASMAATQAEQDMFLRQQQQGSGGGQTDATTEEMERILKQIVDDAKTEVKAGETDGKAVNRLMKVRSHIIMGTKL